MVTQLGVELGGLLAPGLMPLWDTLQPQIVPSLLTLSLACSLRPSPPGTGTTSCMQLFGFKLIEMKKPSFSVTLSPFQVLGSSHMGPVTTVLDGV